MDGTKSELPATDSLAWATFLSPCFDKGELSVVSWCTAVFWGKPGSFISSAAPVAFLKLQNGMSKTSI